MNVLVFCYVNTSTTKVGRTFLIKEDKNICTNEADLLMHHGSYFFLFLGIGMVCLNVFLLLQYPDYVDAYLRLAALVKARNNFQISIELVIIIPITLFFLILCLCLCLSVYLLPLSTLFKQ